MNLNTPIKRPGLTNEAIADMYGPLSDLIGIWSGNKGVNLVAVPNQAGDFTLLVTPYSETITITALSSPTPNRGLTSIEQIPTLMYSLSIYNSDNNNLLHAENGIWELVDPAQNGGFNIARIATVPHGDAVLALGTSSVTDGPPDINTELSAAPTGGLPPILGYADIYSSTILPGFNNTFPNLSLTAYLEAQAQAGQKVISTINLPVSTLNKGGITNIPSVGANANATQFESTFWIETVQDENTGQTFLQLQYSQNTILEFPVNGTPAGQTIQWPHININTLIKQ